MKNGIQTNFPHMEIKTYGCYFLTLCAWVYHAFGNIFTKEMIISKFEQYKLKKFTDWQGNTRPWIGDSAFINAPTLVFNDLAGKPDYFKNVAKTSDVPNTKRFPVFFEKLTHGGFDHFALGEAVNGEVKIIFDGWNPGAEARGLKITNYRAFS